MKLLAPKPWWYSAAFDGPLSTIAGTSFRLPLLSSRSFPRLLLTVTALLFVLFICLSRHTPSYTPTRVTYGTTAPSRAAIPNIVHFVYILPDAEADFAFEFSHFLSLYATWFYWRPEQIYLHTNVLANDTAVTRARDGEAGKWNRLVLGHFDLTINTVEVPTHAHNGVKIKGMEHRSDFVRVKAVHDLGGIYIDWDVHPLRDVQVLRESGFRAVAGRQQGGQINSGVFMSVRGGTMMRLWMEGMHQAYTGGWTTHSNEVITKYGQRLVRQPGEVLIMDQDAFAPGSWNDRDTDALFAAHVEEPSNLANYTTGDPLPRHDEAFGDRWEHPEAFPAWSLDYSSSYMLHAFSPGRWHHVVQDFEHITPRYVLERRSNFARAVYPVARQMLEEGLISVDDSHVADYV